MFWEMHTTFIYVYLRPGLETLEKFGGFPPFMKWDGPTISDSGGYQVSFLWNNAKNKVHKQSLATLRYGKQSLANYVGSAKDRGARNSRVSDEGFRFYSHIDGSKHLLTPEKSMEIQSVLGADIIMALDQPMGLEFTKAVNRESYERTFKWEERSLSA